MENMHTSALKLSIVKQEKTVWIFSLNKQNQYTTIFANAKIQVFGLEKIITYWKENQWVLLGILR